jgi:hypothetical protein
MPQHPIGLQFPMRNTKWLKNGKFRKAILSAFYNILQRNFGILLIVWCSFKLWWIFCLDQNFSYKGKGPLASESLHESFSSFPGQTRAKVAWEATECYRAKQSNDQYSHQLEVNENALELMKIEGETRAKVATLTHSLLPYPGTSLQGGVGGCNTRQ